MSPASGEAAPVLGGFDATAVPRQITGQVGRHGRSWCDLLTKQLPVTFPVTYSRVLEWISGVVPLDK